MLKLVDSTHLTAEQMAPLWSDTLSCIAKYCARFAQEETPENVITEVAKGNRKMWLVLDEEGRVVLAPITAIEELEATGVKQLLLSECGGSRLKEAMPLLADIEDWAKQEHGVSRARFVARKGWTGYLEPLGYRAKAIVFEKDL